MEPLDRNAHQEISEIINKMANESLRTLSLAFKKITDNDLTQKNSRGVYNVETDELILLGVVGVRDYPRQEVADAIKKCHIAGITVLMVTGDNIITAKSIAKEIGLLKEGDDHIAMEGPDFSNRVGGIICKNCRTAVCGCPVTK